MIIEDAQKKRIHAEIEKATVKILLATQTENGQVEYSFVGTGFFITPDQILTAYHCIGDYEPGVVVESPVNGRFSAQLDKEKSLRNTELDIAVLKINGSVTHYLPLGFISRHNVTDDIVAVGCPAGDIPGNEKIGFYSGTITKVREDNKFENDAMKGEGQSGGPVYHYASQRVIGLADTVYDAGRIVNAGLAVRFERLFENWEELNKVNEEVAKKWDKRLGGKQSMTLKMGWGSISLLLVVVILVGMFLFPTSVIKLLPPPKRYEVKLVIPSYMKDAMVSVDGKPAIILSTTLTSITIEVAEKESNHIILVTKEGRVCSKEQLIRENVELTPCQ